MNSTLLYRLQKLCIQYTAGAASMAGMVHVHTLAGVAGAWLYVRGLHGP